MHAAMQGRRAIVLTIDPAKRLASSMGLESLSDEPMLIHSEHFPEQPSGTLHAMMLDTKRSFDRVIERYAPSEEAKKTIFANRLYQHMSNMMAGSQEYMAMERLYEIYQRRVSVALHLKDAIVLDQPRLLYS